MHLFATTFNKSRKIPSHSYSKYKTSISWISYTILLNATAHFYFLSLNFTNLLLNEKYIFVDKLDILTI